MERELKFLLEHAHIPALPNDYRLGEPEATLHLLDEYLDYRGHILAAGWRLRRRRSDGREVRYTLKSVRGGDASGPLSERTEIERTPERSEELPSEIVLALAEAGVDTAHVLDRLQPYPTLRPERQPVATPNCDGEFALHRRDMDTAVAAPPLGDPNTAMVLGRPGGPEFRPFGGARLGDPARGGARPLRSARSPPLAACGIGLCGPLAGVGPFTHPFSPVTPESCW